MRKSSMVLMLMLVCQVGWAGVDFDGTDDFIDTGSQSTLDNKHAFSVCQYIYRDGASNLGMTWSKRSAGSFQKHFVAGDFPGVEPDDTLGVFMNMSGTDLDVKASANSAPTSTNLCVCCTVSSSYVGRLYVNGVETSYYTQVTGTGSPIDDASASAQLGRNSDGSGNYFDGKIYDHAFWDKQLSAQEVASYCNGVKRSSPQIAPTNLMNALALDDQPDGTSGNGDTYRDLTVNANNGTGDDGANNTGLSNVAEQILSYP